MKMRIKWKKQKVILFGFIYWKGIISDYTKLAVRTGSNPKKAHSIYNKLHVQYP